MRRVLVGVHGLHGNVDDYYDPDNSYLNRVLDRGLGAPISLSVIWMEVARRLKWPVSGLGLPGHFIIRFDDDERFILVDPFYSGRTLRIEDCRRLLEHNYDGKVAFCSRFLLPVDTRTVLVRMLNNLRNIYVASQNWQAVADVLRRLAKVEPQNAEHLHELAGLLYHRGNVRGAHAHLSAYLRNRPDAEDQLIVRERLAHLEAVIALMN
jgi:regulator of sirC expression with transglutaminase-like and TPR domain